MKPSSSFPAAFLLLLLLSAISVFTWLGILAKPEAGIVGCVALVLLLGLWANTLWVCDQWEQDPGGRNKEELEALRERLLRRLWGWLGLGTALLAGGLWFLDSTKQTRGGNERSAEKTMEQLFLSQASFVHLRRSENKVLRCATSLEELSEHLDTRGKPLLPENLRDGEDKGYRFIQMATYNAAGGADPRHGFAYCAAPVQYGVTGRRKWVCRNNDFSMWYIDDGTDHPETRWVWPDDQTMVAAGWTCTDGFGVSGLPPEPP